MTVCNSVVRLFMVSAACSFFLGLCRPAAAEPVLQLYLEGADYNTATESWQLAANGYSESETFRLWVIGGTRSKKVLTDVRLSVAYGANYRSYDTYGNVVKDLTVTLTPATTGGLYGFTDSSIPIVPHLVDLGAADTQPSYGYHSSLPSHGIYGTETVWQEWSLGSFELSDSPIGDFGGTVPQPQKKKTGQINVYDVSIALSDGSPLNGLRIHFDVYNYAKNGHGEFAPFSHDADVYVIHEPEGGVIATPEPTTLVALGGIFGTLGLGWVVRRRRGSSGG